MDSIQILVSLVCWVDSQEIFHAPRRETTEERGHLSLFFIPMAVELEALGQAC